jgi:hypothetical protein
MEGEETWGIAGLFITADPCLASQVASQVAS